MVPLIPSRILSYGKQAIVELIPLSSQKRYEIKVRVGVSSEEMAIASIGTLRSDGRGQDPSGELFRAIFRPGLQHRSPWDRTPS